MNGMRMDDSTIEKTPSLEDLFAKATGIYFHGLVDQNGSPALSLGIRDAKGKVHEVIVPCSSELFKRAQKFMNELEIEVVSTFQGGGTPPYLH